MQSTSAIALYLLLSTLWVGGQHSSVSAQKPTCAGIPQVKPWSLKKAVLFGNATASSYYKNVVLAGDVNRVSTFLDCYNLTTRWHRNYASAYKIWAACTEIEHPNNPRQNQAVCVAVDSNGRELDQRIFDNAYAMRVGQKVFR